MVASPISAAALGAGPSIQSTARPVNPWIVSARFDIGFFLLSGLIVLVPLIATRVFHTDPYLILAAVAVTSNGPHLASTWSRVYLDTRELRRRPFAFVGVPLAIALTTIAMIHQTNQAYSYLTSIILYWATYHFAAQCYGLLRLYHRKSGEAPRLAHRAESTFVYSMAASGLLWRLHFGPRWLFGVQAIAPEIPWALVVASLAVTCTSLLCVFVDQVRRVNAGETVPWRRMAFLGAVLSGFGVPFLLIKDGTAAFASAACWHGIQYLGIVYHFNRQKFGGQPLPKGAGLIAWVSQPRRLLAYGALIMAMIGAAYGSLFVISAAAKVDMWRLSLATWTTLTLSHYWVDGLIWKMRNNDTARVLAVDAASVAPAVSRAG